MVIADGRAEIEELTGSSARDRSNFGAGCLSKRYWIRNSISSLPAPASTSLACPWLQLKANATLHASGDFRAGLVKGDVRLLDGRFSRRLEVIPISVVSASDDDPFRAPRFDGVFPRPFNRWGLDVSLTNDSSFFFSDTPSAGEILAELHLTGTLEYPLPLGQIKLKDVRAFLPFTTLTIPDGYLEFVEESPWIPRTGYPRDRPSARLRCPTLCLWTSRRAAVNPALRPIAAAGIAYSVVDHRHGAGCVCSSSANRSARDGWFASSRRFHAQAVVRWQRR